MGNPAPGATRTGRDGSGGGSEPGKAVLMSNEARVEPGGPALGVAQTNCFEWVIVSDSVLENIVMCPTYKMQWFKDRNHNNADIKAIENLVHSIFNWMLGRHQDPEPFQISESQPKIEPL
ncbi:hypothetical protein FRC06_003587, partial [Ceratobasidium sp. 370]